MKREILFRGFSKELNDFVEGDLIQEENETFIYSKKVFANEVNGTPHFGRIRFKIDQDSVGEFIEIVDKNDVSIFEGDIVRSIFSYNGLLTEITGIVEKDICNPCFVIHNRTSNGIDQYEYDFVQCGMRTNEIIGNIHKNPTILKWKLKDQ